MKIRNAKEKINVRMNEPEVDSYQMLLAVEDENNKVKHEKKDLEEQIKEYKAIIASKDEEIQNLKVNINEAGSLAEFSMKISGVFESAQNAASEYIDANRRVKEKGEAVAHEIIDEANKEKANIIEEAMKEKELIINEAKAEARNIRKFNISVLQKIREEANSIIASVIEDDSLDIVTTNTDNSTENLPIKDENNVDSKMVI